MILAVSTSGPLASMALTESSTGAPVFLIENQNLKQHSDFINSALDQLLSFTNKKITDIHTLLIDHGPGSFTGVRVSVSFAKALGYSLNCPIYAFHSLDIIFAQNYTTDYLDQNVLVLTNAYRNSLYASHFKVTPQMAHSIPKPEPFLIKYNQVESYIDQLKSPHPVRLLGNGYQAYFQNATTLLPKIIPPPEASIQMSNYFYTIPTSLLNTRADLKNRALQAPHALGLILLYQNPNSLQNQTHWDSLLPFYLRLSSAEEVLSEKVPASQR